MKYLIWGILPLFLLVTSCGDDEPVTGCDSDFDQESMYINLADNLILPAYDALSDDVDELNNQINNFLAFPSEGTLTSAQTAFKEAYKTWQIASPYNFGPAETLFLRNSLNNFPVNTTEVDANISSGTYDFNTPDAYDKGFPALDYLLFNGTDNASIVATLSQNNHKQYLQDLITDIKTRVDETILGWVGYRQTFIQNTGTAAGTSLSLVVNQLNENYEYIKRDKIGIPSGTLTLGFTNADKVEAYYSGISAELAQIATQTTLDFYTGKDGLGLDDFLVDINAMKAENTLDNEIQTLLNNAITALNTLPDPFADYVESNTDEVVTAYNELVKPLVALKTDMPSVLCVSITYIDNPSDSD